MKTKNLVLACSLLITLTSVGCKKDDATTAASDSGGGSGTPTLSRYLSTCTTTSGAVYQANSMKYWLTTSGSTYTWTQLYYTDSGCSSSAFSVSTAGTFTIGAATTAPSGGYKITFTPTSSSLTSYTASISGDLNTHCGSHWNTGTATSTYNTGTSGLSCSGGALGLVATSTPLYNVFVISGSVIELGSMTETNPGVTSSGLVSTTTSLNIPQY